MTIEEKLKDLILARYKSIREFTQVTDMPYSTVTSIFKRGVENSSVTNIIRICKELGISVDELAEGNIVPDHKVRPVQGFEPGPVELDDILNQVKYYLGKNPNLVIDGQRAGKEAIDSIIDAIDIGLAMAKKKNKIG